MYWSIFILVLFQAFSIKCIRTTDNLITSWKVSNQNGFNNYKADVTGIKYNNTYVFVSTNSIPSYQIGPWKNRQSIPIAQNKTFRFNRYPIEQSKLSKTKVGIGSIGLWRNGISLVAPFNGRTYLNLGVWTKNVYYWEKETLDDCNGHVDPSLTYHNHFEPVCLHNSSTRNLKKHSELLGYLFDSFPIYGITGFSDALDMNSDIKIIKSSYRLKRINERKSTSQTINPNISSIPLGAFIEDYEYIKGLGDLDEFNGR